MRHFTGPFIVTFLIAIFVLVMQFLWKYVAELAGKGLEVSVILELLFYATANLIPMALPLAVLLSSIMTYGDLAEHNELVAYKSSGGSLLRAMVPLGMIVIVFAVGSYFFSNKVLPKANLRFAALLWDIKSQKPSFDLKPGVFYSGIDGYSIRIAKNDISTNMIYDVLIYDHTGSSENLIVIKSESGRILMNDSLNIITFTLFNGYRYEEMRDSRTSNMNLPHSRLKFKEYKMDFDLTSFHFDRSDLQLFRGNFKMLDMKELRTKADSVNKEIEKLVPMTREYIRPYFYLMKDSALSKFPPRPVVLAKGEIINSFPESERKRIIHRALANTRTIGHLVNSPASQIEFSKNALYGYLIEWHRKIVLSLVIFLMFIIGAPMGAIIRKGGLGLPTVVSILLFIAYYVISIMGEKLSKELILEPWLGMWLPLIILVPVGVFLTHKANTDSNIFRDEGYKFKIFKKKSVNQDELQSS